MVVIESSMDSCRNQFIKELEDWQDLLEIDINYSPKTLQFAMIVSDGEVINVFPVIRKGLTDYWIIIPWKYNKRPVDVKNIHGIGRAAEFKVIGAHLLPTFRQDLVPESKNSLLYV